MSARSWVELHTAAVDAAIDALESIGFTVDRVDLAELGRAGRLLQAGVPCGAVVPRDDEASPEGWVPFHATDRLPVRTWSVPPVRLPGGTRALAVDAAGRPVGWWEGGPCGPLVLEPVGSRWALVVASLPDGAGWSVDGRVGVHATGVTVVGEDRGPG